MTHAPTLGIVTHDGSARRLPAEVPVAMVFDAQTQAVMMATPADLADFATGFALTEGYVETPDQIRDIEIVTHDTGHEARVWLAADRASALNARRRSMMGPVGCGLCGIDSLAQALRPIDPLPPGGATLTAADVARATEALRAHQPLHDETIAVHAAGFWQGGGIMLAREDVGRHNALDKLIGALLRAGIDPASGAIVLTSRVSVDMVQKVARARCPILIAASAPTAQALDLAQGAGLTVAASARNGRFDLYTHPDRIRG